jgi:hypothetical protein
MMGCVVQNSLKWLAWKEEVGVGGGASEILTSHIENILQYDKQTWIEFYNCADSFKVE